MRVYIITATANRAQEATHNVTTTKPINHKPVTPDTQTVRHKT